MIQTHMIRRNTLTPALSALLAAGLLATTAQAAKVDAQITAARNAAATADIEQISSIGADIGDKFGTGEIKSNGKNLKSAGVFLADAIIAKTEAVPPSPTDRNRPDNKADEIGELGAFLVEGLANNAKFLKKKGAVGAKQVIVVMKGFLKTAKKTAQLFGTTIFRDAAGSVALTIHNDPGITDDIEEKIQKKLVKSSKKIAGKTNRTAIQTGFAEGFDGGLPSESKYEDGNIDSLRTVEDPETDNRPA